MIKRSLSIEDLQAVLEIEDVTRLNDSELVLKFSSEKGIAEAAPNGQWAVDPRSGTMVVYNPARARRPHDNRGVDPSDLSQDERPCPICEGKTTGVLDVRPLSSGFTFINKNLFPCVVASGEGPAVAGTLIPFEANDVARADGLHFLQWTSSIHDRDWHNMPIADLEIVLRRLGALEKKLLSDSAGRCPETSHCNPGAQTFGFVSIIKNFGAPVGGSLTHGHQQIVHSNVMPAEIFHDKQFFDRTGQSISARLQMDLNPKLVVRDFGDALLCVPYYMRRPYQTLLLFRHHEKRFLHELDDKEIFAAAAGWAFTSRAFLEMLPKLGKTPAYNVMVHNGPSGGLYIEFLPFTQETGGYEQLGLFVCHETPAAAAAVLRETIGRY